MISPSLETVVFSRVFLMLGTYKLLFTQEIIIYTGICGACVGEHRAL